MESEPYGCVKKTSKQTAAEIAAIAAVILVPIAASKETTMASPSATVAFGMSLRIGTSPTVTTTGASAAAATANQGSSASARPTMRVQMSRRGTSEAGPVVTSTS